ncbi:MAG TPA: EAL domain-containing protein [Gallionella sp.]|nr:EAL domain-containing protein [Gallionella sp.]
MTEADIIDGLRKDEFTFFYQPKVSLITGKVIGAEALIRWIKPNGTMVMPEEFIPLAERSDLICDITRHMFPKLVNDLLVLLDIDEHLTVSFNASAKDFMDDRFTRMMLERIEQAQLPPSSLQVELTETVTLESGDTVRTNILPLRENGLSLAMDDFGIGYSSLDTLSKWPFTTIKLDQGIIGRMLESEKNSTIVESSVRMAHELGISVVAEGVENNAQYQHLLESGCTKIQGYWISRPLPLDKFIVFVEQDIRWSGLPIGLIHMAIIDHVQWRKQLVSEVAKLAVLPKDALHRRYPNVPPLSCHDCRLGLWYEGPGQLFRDRPSFSELEKPHCEFHQVGKKLVDMVAAGANLEELTPNLRELSEHSMQVLSKLQSLENEGLFDMHHAHEQWVAHAFHPSRFG